MTTKLNIKIILLIIVTAVCYSCGQIKSQPKAMILSTEKSEVQVLSLLTISEKKEVFKLTFGAIKDTSFQLAMRIGKYESQTLAITLEKLKPAVPLPLDILQEAIIKFGYTVKEAIIDSAVNDIYTAKIICVRENKTVEFTARPVDATTIALKFDAPIFVRTDLLER